MLLAQGLNRVWFCSLRFIVCIRSGGYMASINPASILLSSIYHDYTMDRLLAVFVARRRSAVAVQPLDLSSRRPRKRLQVAANKTQMSPGTTVETCPIFWRQFAAKICSTKASRASTLVQGHRVFVMRRLESRCRTVARAACFDTLTPCRSPQWFVLPSLLEV